MYAIIIEHTSLTNTHLLYSVIKVIIIYIINVAIVNRMKVIKRHVHITSQV